jgi:hypothetical protein
LFFSLLENFMSNPLYGAFGCVNFSLTVLVPVLNATSPARPKRVKLATVWCEYADRHAVIAQFTNANGPMFAGDLQAEFVLREGLDCEPDRTPYV